MTSEFQDREAADALAELSDDYKKDPEIEEFETQETYASEYANDIESSKLVYVTLLIVSICIILSVLPTDRFAPQFIQNYFYANSIVKSVILAVCVMIVLKTYI